MIQRIKLSSGCPNNCPYCYETTKIELYDLPEIADDYVQILDMNFLACRKDGIEILERISKRAKQIEFVCGIDYRYLTQEIANAMKKNKVIKVRWAWDYGYEMQFQMLDTFNKFIKAGYDPESLSVFMVTNWKIPMQECIDKLDLLKVWGVKVNDCCYDGGYRLAIAKDWTADEIKSFRHKCRKHNQLVIFKHDPEFKNNNNLRLGCTTA